MGQSASSHRGNDGSANRRTRDFSQLLSDHEPRPELEDTSHGAERSLRRQYSSSSAGPSSSSRRLSSSQSSQPFATVRRHVLPQSGSTSRGTIHDEILYEQEERLLTGMEDQRPPQTATTNAAASPLARRPSVVSRLGGRLFSRNSVHGSLGIDDGEGETPRRRLRRRRTDQASRETEENSDERHRLSMLGSLPHDFPRLTRQRRSTHRVSDTPVPLLEDQLETSELGGGGPTHVLQESPPVSTRRRLFQTSSEANRRSRREFFRRSISSPLELFMSNPSSNQSTTDRQGSVSNRRPAGTATADETDYLLPPLNVTDTNIDLDDNFSSPNEQHETRNSEAPPITAEPAELPAWTQRLADRTSTARRETRRVPNLLRGRSSRIIRRDDEAPLSRILQLAAAAIAAQLSGNPDNIGHMQPVADDGLDGSLNNFMETLNNATNSTTTFGDDTRALSTLPPLNFLRVFRFVNGQSERRPSLTSPSRQEPPRTILASEPEASEAAADGRTVTLVVVGVRSVPSASINRDGTDVVEPNLDALLSLPLTSVAPTPNPLRSATGGLLRFPNGRSRFTHRRRASMGGLNTFPANYDSQRHQRMQSSSRPVSGDSTPVASTSIPLVLSESPPGPHPPPSTPADPYRSAQASAATTPSRRPSSASAAQPPIFTARDSHELHNPGSSSAIELDATQAPRQRRRSDSEFARHGDLGAGAARRNGVVEPDHVPASGRSWLIYVVGTNLSEDHPAFATPSLFTDVSVFVRCPRYHLLTYQCKNPTYEDMLLLSSLIGPAKPPVASREAVASESGVYRVRRENEIMVAVSVEGQGSVQMQIPTGERCLVCLCEYELAEEVRMLAKCSHLFHRDCIDVVCVRSC